MDPGSRAAATPPILALRESAAEPRVVSRARTANRLVLAAAAIVTASARWSFPAARRAAGVGGSIAAGQLGGEPTSIGIDGARAHARHRDGDDVRHLREL
jgi:putative ABC transport system permease protein